MELCNGYWVWPKKGRLHKLYGKIKLSFATNKIANENKKKIMLISSYGIGFYQIVKKLTAPVKPTDNSFVEVVTLISNH